MRYLRPCVRAGGKPIALILGLKSHILMRILLVAAIMLLAGCSGSPESYFPASNELPSGWSYEAPPRQVAYDGDGDFPTPNRYERAAIAGPSGAVAIAVLRYADTATATEAHENAKHFQCDGDDMSHVLTDTYVLIFVEKDYNDKSAETQAAIRAIRDAIASTTSAEVIC